MSPGHFLYSASRTPVFAKDVVVGDLLRTHNNNNATVLDISRVQRRGRYAPHTETGTLVVFPADKNEGALVSSYSDVLHPSLAHFYFYWRRILFSPDPIKVDSIRKPWKFENYFILFFEWMLKG